ncbi:ATP-grasp domain-containing protein [Methylococcus sp. EFPC2]|uniref:ATP-grasp domain-containing protein n=1 Tax=Methylococcus sp. EFPC2 TaxID=2812648 RepID=UPI001967AFC7|nr:ATP-grasp domain-containing protein [Methylococcus sp. EFPC2]QSA96732.1 ATP-grasp domain-containing protein [Methylococcus sp. EFPC2]
MTQARPESAGSALLLVAVSARMLAQSAARGGYASIAVDGFGDEDTLNAASQHVAVADFDAPVCLDELSAFVSSKDVCGVVYGGGIDTRPAWLDKLEAGWPLLGNSPATVHRANEPHEFFALLDRLAIPYPEIRFEVPETLDGWLRKSACGEGGMGVRFLAEPGRLGPCEYFQRHVAGRIGSLLFLADGQDIVPIGFNTLWTAGHDPAHPFLFAGAINRLELDAAQRPKLNEYALKLTRALGLVGLNSLDIVMDGEVCRVLELNPRPSATMSLYDEDFPAGLLRAHIDACRGRLDGVVALQGRVRAFRVIYAPRALTLPFDKRLPIWCADRPMPGACIAAGSPLCSVQAMGTEESQVLSLLAEREGALLTWLGI